MQRVGTYPFRFTPSSTPPPYAVVAPQRAGNPLRNARRPPSGAAETTLASSEGRVERVMGRGQAPAPPHRGRQSS